MDRTKALLVTLGVVVTVSLFGSLTPACAFDGGPTDYRYRNDPYLRSEPQNVGTVKKLVPGVLGALVGGFLGGHFGMVGRIVGGVAGWYVGNQVGKMLFPGSWYSDYENYPWYYRQQQRYSATSTTSGTDASSFSFSLDTPTYAPLAPEILDSKVTALREAYFKALAEYQKVLSTGTEAEKKTSKATYEAAYKAYTDAKKSSLGN